MSRNVTASGAGFRVLMMVAAAIGLLATLANSVWGTDFPDTERSASKPGASAAKYLSARPFDALALVNYSQSVENQIGGTAANRERTLLLASQLAPNDVEVIKAHAALAFQRGETLVGLNHVARWARISPADRAAAINILLSAAGNREWEPFIAEQLKKNWPLADPLLLAACGKLGGNQLLALGAAISRNGAIRSETSACVSRKLVAENRSPDARAFWLGTLRPLPPKIGHVFNGDFSLPLGSSPFNWTLAEGGEFRDGFRVGVVNGAGPDGTAPALFARFNGRRVNSALVNQALALPPGNYRLRYMTQQTGFANADSARWVLRCDTADAVVEQRAEPAQALKDGWRRSVELFAIPETCTGQTIRLELSSRLQQLTGSNATALFTDIEVERINI